MTLAAVESPVIRGVVVAPASTPELDKLARLANAEHAEVLSSVRTAVLHAIKSGEALLRARELVGAGEWQAWVSANFDGASATAQQYARLAFHKDRILKSGEAMPLKRAYTYLRGLPAIDGFARRGRRPPPPPDQVAEARRLRASGMTYAAIGEVFGMSGSAIRGWLDPTRRKQLNAGKQRAYQRRKAERLAFRQKERAKAAVKAGGALAESYSLLRKAAQALEQAATEAQTRDDRAAILDALQGVHRAEDHLVRALGIQHGTGRVRTATAARALTTGASVMGANGEQGAPPT